jgi:dolichol-phosphate mannosyltransferase
MNSPLRATESSAESAVPRLAPARADASDPATETERILVAIATYNELESLPDLVQEVRRVLPGADLLIVDDNSPDGTGKWVAEKSESDPQVAGIHRPRKMGLGSATLAALRYAVEHNYTYVVALDADGSHDPRYIPAMLDTIRGNGEEPPDIVIGSRYVPGGGTEGWPLHRRLMSRMVNAFARLMLGLPVRDCSGAFRCTRVEMLRKVDLGSFRSGGYSLFEELLWRCKQASARFEEVPIVFSNRTRGQSKINARESISALWMLMRLGLRNWLRIG